MGKIKKGILGGFSGKVGTVIGSTWKGIAYMRSIPQSVKNPKTQPQREQRGKFALTMGLLKPLNPLLQIGWRQQANRQSPINAAMSYHIANAISGDYPDFEIDYQKIVVSRGNLPGVKDLQISTISATEIGLEWTYFDESTTSPDDELSLCVLNHTKNDIQINIRDVVRSDGSITFGLPSHWEAGDSVSIYIFFTSADNKNVSTSQSLVNQTLA